MLHTKDVYVNRESWESYCWGFHGPEAAGARRDAERGVVRREHQWDTVSISRSDSARRSFSGPGPGI